jgi:hypothetical protein
MPTTDLFEARLVPKFGWTEWRQTCRLLTAFALACSAVFVILASFRKQDKTGTCAAKFKLVAQSESASQIYLRQT